MLRKEPKQSEPQTHLFRPLLAEFINLKHELIVLGQKLDWAHLEAGFYNNFGAPAKPVRLCRFVDPQTMFNKSVETIVEEWKQNPYYQHFTGGIYFD